MDQWGTTCEPSSGSKVLEWFTLKCQRTIDQGYLYIWVPKGTPEGIRKMACMTCWRSLYSSEDTNLVLAIYCPIMILPLWYYRGLICFCWSGACGKIRVFESIRRWRGRHPSSSQKGWPLTPSVRFFLRLHKKVHINRYAVDKTNFPLHSHPNITFLHIYPKFSGPLADFTGYLKNSW